MKFKHIQWYTLEGGLTEILQRNPAPGNRLWVYFYKGTQCVSCGIQGTFFARDSNTWKSADGRRSGAKAPHTSYHLNLWAVQPDGTEILMTRDHITPVRYGGKDTLENSQPMCSVCNTLKGIHTQTHFLTFSRIIERQRLIEALASVEAVC